MIDGQEQAPALVVTGDDFGLSEAVNRAIITAHQCGVLTSASLMVNEAAAADAIRLAHAHPRLAVGLHLTLVLGHAALTPAEIPHLVNAGGEFPTGPFRAGVKYFFHPSARREVRREMRAQFEKFAASGLPLSHVDGHNHLHLHPVVFSELIGVCEEFGVRRVRVVGDEWRTHRRIVGRGGSHSRQTLQTLQTRMMSAIFGLLARSAGRKLSGRGFESLPRVYGLLRSGAMDEEYLLALVAAIERTSSEIYLHPLAPDADAAERRYNPGGADELAALVSPRLREAIAARGFRLAPEATI